MINSRQAILPGTVMTGKGKMAQKKSGPSNSLWTNEKVISEAWIGAKPDDIGSGFRTVEIDPFAKRGVQETESRSKTQLPRTVARKLKDSKRRGSKRPTTIQEVMRSAANLEYKKEQAGERRHRFLNGSSSFVFYRLRVNTRELKNTPKAVSSLNFKNKLKVSEKTAFARSLQESIQKQSDFYIEEILPKTNALMSALQRVDELSLQMFEAKSDLPVDFIRGKSREAVQLLIIRHLCEVYELTTEERKLMINEYRLKRNPLTLL